MLLNALQQQEETKWNNPLNYCIFKKNHHLVVQTVCARPSLASWAIFSPCSCCAWNLAVLKEVPRCLPQALFWSTKSTLPLPALGFKAQLPSLQTSDCSVYFFMRKWRKNTCQISLLHHQFFFFYLPWLVNPTRGGVLLFRPCWNSLGLRWQVRESEDSGNSIFLLLLNWRPMLTHSPGCSFGNLLLLPAGRWMSSLVNFSVRQECEHKAPFTSSLQRMG